MIIYRGWYGHDKNRTLSNFLQITGVAQLFSCLQISAFQLAGAVISAAQFVDTLLIDVKADGGKLFAELGGQRQTNIAEADDGDGKILRLISIHRFVPFAIYFLALYLISAD